MSDIDSIRWGLLGRPAPVAALPPAAPEEDPPPAPERPASPLDDAHPAVRALLLAHLDEQTITAVRTSRLDVDQARRAVLSVLGRHSQTDCRQCARALTPEETS